MKKIITILIIIILIIALIFIKFYYKKINIENNMSNNMQEEIAEYILDINSYDAQEEITVYSNKNSNKYIVKEKYIKDENLNKKEIIEPENLKGISFTYDGANLKVENSNLNLSKIYENYPYIGEETTSIAGFINNYRESNETKVEEVNDEIVITIKIKNGNKYAMYKSLYIDKNTITPKKMEIQDKAQKTVVYILYTEIKINNLPKEDIISFKLQEISSDI